MGKMTRGLFVGAVCVGLLAGCSKNAMTSAMSNGMDTVMDNVPSTMTDDMLKQGVDGAKKGDAKAAIGYLSSWYALQKDKEAAKQKLKKLAAEHAQDKAGKIIDQALTKVTK